jgi:hypothetical protein
MAAMTPEEFFGVTWPDPVPVAYRLYHDDQGLPLFYSMDTVPGTYIEITQEQYNANSMWVRVVDGKLVERRWQTSAKLAPGETGTPCHPQDVSIVFETGIPWSLKTYEEN